MEKEGNEQSTKPDNPMIFFVSFPISPYETELVKTSLDSIFLIIIPKDVWSHHCEGDLDLNQSAE